MIIDCISDLHGAFPQLDGGDLLIVAGDLTACDTFKEQGVFAGWLSMQNYTKKIFISGNHDNTLLGIKPYDFVSDNISYLCDTGTEFEGLKIWGSPWSLWFHGINPHCKAFTGKEKDLQKKWRIIPADTDILISHSPPYGILDSITPRLCEIGDLNVGSVSLRNLVTSVGMLPNLKLHVFGHIHEHGGKMVDTCIVKFVNASIMNEYYEPVNKPVRVII